MTEESYWVAVRKLRGPFTGTIGALDNTTGVVGVAPGARLWPVQVLGPTGAGTTSTVLCGIDHVTQNADRIDVVNMSLGGSGADDGNCGRTNGNVMHQATCNSVAKGLTYALAAGNSHADARNSVPAAYDEVINVSALADLDGKPGGPARPTCRAGQADTFADFSNYGPDIDLIAPTRPGLHRTGTPSQSVSSGSPRSDEPPPRWRNTSALAEVRCRVISYPRDPSAWLPCR
ncbi:subtilisin family serine protease [Streptomyces sp. V4I23]|uniref:S8 family serine peptidase n=1 Tax=Streptomyces sp. V4I23 TaxID=3042282 RepID=UPI0027840677|nr:S8 family serine peptidase [Streptomyces sp. V4I23]MDQ1006950.1 subtilisin family serine protease [Streptomyces sp. V4I23]